MQAKIKIKFYSKHLRKYKIVLYNASRFCWRPANNFQISSIFIQIKKIKIVLINALFIFEILFTKSKQNHHRMQPTPPYIKMLKILHLALLIGQVLLSLAMFSLVYFNISQMFELESMSQEILIATIILTAIASLGGNGFFNKKLAAIQQNDLPVAQKLEAYRAANLIRWAMMEFVVILCCVLFFLTGNYYILLVVAIMIVFFFTTKPGTEKTLADLELSLPDLDV